MALTLRIDWKLEKIIKRDGLLMTTSRGDRRRNPAAVDHRATATNLARTLNGIHLGDNTAGQRKAAPSSGPPTPWDRDGVA